MDNPFESHSSEMEWFKWRNESAENGFCCVHVTITSSQNPINLLPRLRNVQRKCPPSQFDSIKSIYFAWKPIVCLSRVARMTFLGANTHTNQRSTHGDHLRQFRLDLTARTAGKFSAFFIGRRLFCQVLFHQLISHICTSTTELWKPDQYFFS